MSFLVVLQLCMHVQMSCLSNKPELSVKAKQKRMCHFKVTNQSDERISWISVASVLIRCLKAPQLAICCIKARKCSTTKQMKKQQHSNSQITWSALRHTKPFNTGTKLKLVTGVDKRLLSCRAPSCGSELGWPPTQLLHHKTQGTTTAGVSHADVSVANMLRLFTERGNGGGTRFRGHISGQTSWRQPGSYHGHGIDVLLTEQRLEKQHCTLGKRESGWDGSGETAKCVSSE